MEFNENEIERIYEEGLRLLECGENTQAAERFKVAATKNHLLSQLELGKLIIADPKIGSYKEAAGYFRSAAEQGDAEAQSLLGRMYLDGEGVEQSDRKAFKWISQAANQKEPYALNYLGYIYYEGKGVEKSYEKALDCFINSSEEGNPEGSFNAGSMFLHGEGTDKNISKAEEFFSSAADAGDSLALIELAKIYLQTNNDKIPELTARFEELLSEDETLLNDYEEFIKIVSEYL